MQADILGQRMPWIFSRLTRVGLFTFESGARRIDTLLRADHKCMKDLWLPRTVLKC